MKEKCKFNYFIILSISIIMFAITGCNNDSGDTELAISKDESAQTTDEQETVSTETIYVYICGEVNNPGVYEIHSGARLFEVIELAGGMKDDAAEDYLNLAREVVDGEQINVISLDEYEQINSSAEESGEAEDGLININTATATELTALPGIGEVKAEAIVSYREKNGDFATIDEIMNVDGIKESSFAKIQNLIKVK